VPTYKLLSESGEDLGPLRISARTWKAGDRIHRGHKILEIVTLTEAEAGDTDGVDGYSVVRVSADF
jgi:hypothetical protein